MVLTHTQIYYASEEFGVDDIHTSGGYFHMAEVFQQQHNLTVAQSLYRQVALSLSQSSHRSSLSTLIFISHSPLYPLLLSLLNSFSVVLFCVIMSWFNDRKDMQLS